MKKLVIIGASGHGKVVADIATLLGYDNIVFLDDNPDITECAGFPVIGRAEEANTIDGDKFVAIGKAVIREKIQSSLDNVVTLVHPSAVISRRVSIGKGTVVMAGAVINSDTQIGDGCIVNTCSSVDHDCVVSDYCHVAVGAHIAGTCSISSRTWIGAGATVSNNISICEDCMIGAGTVVVKDIGESGTFIGVPAKNAKMRVNL